MEVGWNQRQIDEGMKRIDCHQTNGGRSETRIEHWADGRTQIKGWNHPMGMRRIEGVNWWRREPIRTAIGRHDNRCFIQLNLNILSTPDSFHSKHNLKDTSTDPILDSFIIIIIYYHLLLLLILFIIIIIYYDCYLLSLFIIVTNY